MRAGRGQPREVTGITISTLRSEPQKPPPSDSAHPFARLRSSALVMCNPTRSVQGGESGEACIQVCLDSLGKLSRIACANSRLPASVFPALPPASACYSSSWMAARPAPCCLRLTWSGRRPCSCPCPTLTCWGRIGNSSATRSRLWKLFPLYRREPPVSPGESRSVRSDTGVCTSRRDVGRHQLGQCSAPCKRAANAYSEGDTGWQAQQGVSLAMAADPLVQRQSTSR